MHEYFLGVNFNVSIRTWALSIFIKMINKSPNIPPELMENTQSPRKYNLKGQTTHLNAVPEIKLIKSLILAVVL